MRRKGHKGWLSLSDPQCRGTDAHSMLMLAKLNAGMSLHEYCTIWESDNSFDPYQILKWSLERREHTSKTSNTSKTNQQDQQDQQQEQDQQDSSRIYTLLYFIYIVTL